MKKHHIDLMGNHQVMFSPGELRRVLTGRRLCVGPFIITRTGITVKSPATLRIEKGVMDTLTGPSPYAKLL